jgi:hypothetical protein
MSRTRKKSGSKSPVERDISFKGGKGKISFHDKEHKDADDKGNVHLDSLTFALVDIKASITGFNEGTSSTVSSNLLEPFETKEKEFIVKTKFGGSYGEYIRGIYKNIKGDLKGIGGKYTKNLIAVADVGDGNQLVNIRLRGGALSSWSSFTEDKSEEDLYGALFTMKRGKLSTRKEGKTVPVTKKQYNDLLKKLKADPLADKPILFHLPEFSSEDISDEMSLIADEYDVTWLEYLDGRSPASEKVTEGVEESDTVESPTPAELTATEQPPEKDNSDDLSLSDFTEDDDEDYDDLPF